SRARGAGQSDAHARLEDSVAAGDPAEDRVEARSIQGMLDDPDQPARGLAREARVRVERDHVADGFEDRGISDHDTERRRQATEQRVELLDLPPLPFPADPRAFPFVPGPRAMEEIEAVALPVCIALVQRFDSGGRRG